MKCFDRSALIDLLVKTANEEAFEASVDRHLRECDRCRERLERGLRLLESVAGDLADLPAPPRKRHGPLQ